MASDKRRSTTSARTKGKTRTKKGGSSRARSSRARRSRGTLALRLIAVALALVAVGGIAGVKFFQTPRGQAVLLDHGFPAYYDAVQESIDAAMRGALEGYGMRRAVRARTRLTRMNGHDVRLREWTIAAGEDVDFVKVNVALSSAVRAVGGRVRSTEEQNDGRTLIVHAGTRRFDTHRITIGKPSPRGGGALGRGDTARGREVPPSGRRGMGRPRVAIVIDDFGYAGNGVAGEMLQVDLPLTISILPSLPRTATMLRRARETGHCTMLHLPLEAEEGGGYDIPPVTTSMSRAEIEELTERYLTELDGVDGVNNHQGSLATADPRVMRAVLDVVRGHHLFFLDSLTSAKSVAYNMALEMGMPAACNRMFLDDDTEDASVVEERLHRLVALAQRHGAAIGIGHPHRWTLEALLDGEDFLKSAGVDLVPVCDIVATRATVSP